MTREGGVLRRLTGDAAVYGLGHVASQILGLIFVPIFTRYLVVADYGVLSWVNVFLNLLIVMVPMGLGHAVIRLVFDAKDPEEERRIIGTGLTACLLLAGLTTPLLLLAAPWLSRVLWGNEDQVAVLRLAVLAVPGATLRYYALSVLRARFRKWAYGIVSVVSVLLLGALNVLMVVVLEMGVSGIFLGGLISLTTAGLLALILIARDVKPCLSWPRLSRMLAYGAPLAPAALAFWVLSYLDRTLLLVLKGSDQVGLYEVGSKVAAIVMFLTFAMTQAYVPLSYELAGKEGARGAYGRILVVYAVGLGWVALTLSAFAGEILVALADPSYHAGVVVVPWLVGGVAVSGAGAVLATGIHLARRTVWVTVISVASAGANLGLNLWWIPSHGLVGAAAATLVSYVLMNVFLVVVAERLHPIGWPWAKVGCAAGASAAGIVAAAHLDSWLLRGILVLAYPAAILVLRVVAWTEVRALIRGTFRTD